MQWKCLVELEEDVRTFVGKYIGSNALAGPLGFRV